MKVLKSTPIWDDLWRGEGDAKRLDRMIGTSGDLVIGKQNLTADEHG